jgi:hypothetical protein
MFYTARKLSYLSNRSVFGCTVERHALVMLYIFGLKGEENRANAVNARLK